MGEPSATPRAGAQSDAAAPRVHGGAWSVERPSLEYQHAFDLCALEAHRVGGAVPVFASSPFYARELLKRLGDCEARLVPLGNWGLSAGSIGQLLGPDVAPADVQTLESLKPQVKAALWAEPRRGGTEQAVSHICRVLPRGGQLYIIASGWLARFLPEWREVDRRPSEHPAGSQAAMRRLRHAGFEIETHYGFHGLESILWGYASRWMAHVGRVDWADRFYFKMRAEYIVRGWQAHWAPVSVATVTRT